MHASSDRMLAMSSKLESNVAEMLLMSINASKRTIADTNTYSHLTSPICFKLESNVAEMLLN
jgi:hypothetical protein